MRSVGWRSLTPSVQTHTEIGGTGRMARGRDASFTHVVPAVTSRRAPGREIW